jgi:kynurenine formamidase
VDRVTQVVDLTQILGPGTILWPDSHPFQAETALRYEDGGAFARNVVTPEHAGTHLDAPVHFDPDGMTVAEIPVGHLVAPAVMIDVSAAAHDDSDLTVEAETIAEHEDEHGEIESGSAVLLRTGWDQFVGDPETYGGADIGDLQFPGFGTSAAELLVDRGVAGLGIDTLSVDPGHALGFPVHHITLPAGLWHLECLVSLDRLPPRGATLFVGAIPMAEGSGSPARVLAVLPV